LRFWPPKKKNYKTAPLSFATVAVLAPQGQFLIKKKITRGTSLRLPRQRRPSQNWPWGPKLPQMKNLGGGFVVFFLGGLKLLLSQKIKKDGKT